MISLRQHAISLAAVFLALAVGVVLGSSVLSDGLLSGLGNDKKELQGQVNTLQNQVNNKQLQIDSADSFDSAMAGRIVHNALAERSVIVITAPEATPAEVDAATKMITESGASISGRVGLTDSFVDSADADQLRAAVTNVVPAGTQLSTAAVDSGSIAGDLLGSVLLLDAETALPQSTPQELELALQTLRSGGFIAYDDGTIAPGQMALIVTGGKSEGEGNQGSVIARFSAAMDSRGAGAVLAGATGSAEGSGAVAVARSDSALSSHLSTVDNVDRISGQITMVLALQAELDDRTGQYGVGPGATAITVQ
ncbi:copper transporter [Tomitella biformata]|uniref:copper transporter n=1 Tax=Tomitella biformata TaxID=630403 RepID=UPI00046662E7|nr:copper transporter [Tomitella biformata]